MQLLVNMLADETVESHCSVESCNYQNSAASKKEKKKGKNVQQRSKGTLLNSELEPWFEPDSTTGCFIRVHT